ncbi:14036_t:CDS:1, partial [Dentiscutata heterogama]
LSIPWMLIGYEENLPIEPFKDYPVDYIWTKNFQYDNNNGNPQTIKHPHLNFDEYCWLGTCTLRCEDNPAYNFGQSNDFISYHFRNNAANNATQICCYQYDLQNNQISNTLRFKTNCAIISDTPDFEVVNPVNHEWKYRPCRLQYLLRNSRTFTGNKWQLRELPKAIFASIHYSDFQGNPLLLNIHKKYPIVKTLNNVTENLNALVGYVTVVK